MRRRDFITLLGPLIVWASNARAQKRAPPEIGLLSSRSPSESAALIAAFHEGLKEAGYVEGRNLAIQYRWAEGHYDRLPTLATDLVGRQVAVIATTGGTLRSQLRRRRRQSPSFSLAIRTRSR
jgi:putative ABC transport system substrate-binding protein